MWCTKSEKEKLRQNVGFPHALRLALGNLWETLDVRVSAFAFVNKEWGISVLEIIINTAKSKMEKL